MKSGIFLLKLNKLVILASINDNKHTNYQEITLKHFYSIKFWLLYLTGECWKIHFGNNGKIVNTRLHINDIVELNI